jgi:hypothetical protein
LINEANFPKLFILGNKKPLKYNSSTNGPIRPLKPARIIERFPDGQSPKVALPGDRGMRRRKPIATRSRRVVILLQEKQMTITELSASIGEYIQSVGVLVGDTRQV